MNLGKLFDWHYLIAPYALNGLSWPMRIILIAILYSRYYPSCASNYQTKK
jgi:hypothetical protein